MTEYDRKWQKNTESDSKLQKVKLFTAVYICLHRRTAHALDELHTWDLEHEKHVGVIQRWQKDNHNMKQTS